MDFHLTTEFARYFLPLLRWGHQSHFFDFYIYLPIVTVPAIASFLAVRRRVIQHHSLRARGRTLRLCWYGLYFYISWMAWTTFAVALKTMIVEELDYQERKWFEPYLPAIHFYVSSASFAYILLVTRSKFKALDWFLSLYLQVALIAGMGVAGYRALYEDIEGALGGVLLLMLFAVCNYDLLKRMRSSLAERIPTPLHAPA